MTAAEQSRVNTHDNWMPCPVCGGDGYTVRPFKLGWGIFCAECDSFLTYGSTKSDAVMRYTILHRKVMA